MALTDMVAINGSQRLANSIDPIVGFVWQYRLADSD
jgi:hypothetical protein